MSLTLSPVSSFHDRSINVLLNTRDNEKSDNIETHSVVDAPLNPSTNISPRSSSAIINLTSSDASPSISQKETVSRQYAVAQYQSHGGDVRTASLDDDDDDDDDGGEIGDEGDGPDPVNGDGDGGDSSLNFDVSPISDSDYSTNFVGNPRNAEFGDLNYGAVVVNGSSYGTNSDGSIYTDGTIRFKTANGVYEASPATPGTYVTARPVTNDDGTAGIGITVNRGA